MPDIQNLERLIVASGALTTIHRTAIMNAVT